MTEEERGDATQLSTMETCVSFKTPSLSFDFPIRVIQPGALLRRNPICKRRVLSLNFWKTTHRPSPPQSQLTHSTCSAHGQSIQFRLTKYHKKTITGTFMNQWNKLQALHYPRPQSNYPCLMAEVIGSESPKVSGSRGTARLRILRFHVTAVRGTTVWSCKQTHWANKSRLTAHGRG